jgi:hypothetical protein
MDLELLRFCSRDDFSLGLLFSIIDEVKEFLCYICEDEYRTVKVWGETRIPAGRYSIDLYLDGKFHNKYSERFPDMHMGMLKLRNVPNFEGVLIHIGNDDDDTAGCLIPGDTASDNWVGNSTATYKRIYPIIASQVFAGPVSIDIIDYDTPNVV